MHQKGYASTKLSDKSGDDVQNFIDKESISDFRLKRIEETGKGKYKKQYMVNVSEEDFLWFQDMKHQLDLKNKELFALLRETYTDQNFLEETGT